MFNSTKTKVTALALVGAMALGGAIYATSALAAGSATAAPATAQTATDPQLRASILDMLKDRMGLTGVDAEKFADQMIARVQSVNPNFDFKAMVNWCSQFIGAKANGRGMMGAGTAPNAGSTNPGSTGPQAGGQAGGSSYGSRGTMGSRGMMGASGLR